eukprot:scaffold6009_cov248-Pinguiococcus_pyrenoidosus.AAC.4
MRTDFLPRLKTSLRCDARPGRRQHATSRKPALEDTKESIERNEGRRTESAAIILLGKMGDRRDPARARD